MQGDASRLNIRGSMIADTTAKASRQMLRRDTNAGFDKSGLSLFSRYRFETGGFAAPRSLNQGAYDASLRTSADEPVLVAEDETTKRRWWLYQDEFYRESEGFDARTVLALILERGNQKERRVKRAIALMEQAPLPRRRRSVSRSLTTCAPSSGTATAAAASSAAAASASSSTTSSRSRWAAATRRATCSSSARRVTARRAPR